MVMVVTIAADDGLIVARFVAAERIEEIGMSSRVSEFNKSSKERGGAMVKCKIMDGASIMGNFSDTESIGKLGGALVGASTGSKFATGDVALAKGAIIFAQSVISVLNFNYIRRKRYLWDNVQGFLQQMKIAGSAFDICLN